MDFVLPISFVILCSIIKRIRTLYTMRFLDIKGLCDYTTLSRATIYRHIKNNTIPSITIGKRRLFYPTDIDNWLRGFGGDNDLPTIQGV
jgi:excisionase family DNA binding protein